MRKLVTLAMVTTAWLCAQCTVYDQSGRSPVYTKDANPSLSTYLANAEAAFQYTNASLAKLPQPKMLLTAQIVPAAGSWLSTAGQIFGNAIQQYMGMLQNDAGVSTQDVNIWGTPLACDASYIGYAAGFTPSILAPCDCAGGAPLAKEAALPSGSGPHCTALSHYDGMFKYAASHGITLRTGWYPGGDEITSCGLTPAPAGVFTEAQYEECMIPFIEAGMNRYGAAITAVQVLEEPTGGMLVAQPFNVADTGKFIQDASTAVKKIVPGTQVGAAASGIAFPSLAAEDKQYWSDWLNPGGTGQYLDFLVADVFPGSCDLSPTGGIPYYSAVLEWRQMNHLAAAKAYNGGVGKPVRIGQSDPPVWCPAGEVTNQPHAYIGEGDAIWENSGLQNQWLWTFMHWASAMGVQSATPYCNIWFFNYTSNQQNDSCLGAWSAQAMSNLSPTPAAALYKQLGTGVTAMSVPVIQSQNGVVNGASFEPGISAGSWGSVLGTNLSYTTRNWQSSDFVNGTQLPTSLDGVFVTVDGSPAYVGYVSPTQINFIIPADSNMGTAQVQVTTNGAVSNTVSAEIESFAPAFFLWNGTYAVATHLDFSPAANPGVITGATPAMPGETIILWGTGFGPTTPPDAIGQLTAGAPAVTTPPTVTIGGAPANVISATMSPGFAGLYQIAVQVPNSAAGDQPVAAQAGFVQSPSFVLLTVQ